MKLGDYLDIKKLEHYITQGYVTARKHNTLPLTIYSYGRKAVYEQHWDDVTCKTRGLIVDNNTLDIVARPFEKFFNYNTHGQPETYPRSVDDVEANFGPPVITEKINGCLGIFYQYGINWGIATKGAFHSHHAEWANRWLANHIELCGRLVFPNGYTPVFEIICQTVQQHVIKYDKDELYLLALINNETGEELTYPKLAHYGSMNAIKLAQWYPAYTLEMALKGDSKSQEGFVITYHIPNGPPLKLKIKFPTFLENRKKFYEALKAKDLGAKPDNGDDYKVVFDKATAIVKDALVHCTLRSEFAEYFNKDGNKPYAPACFALLDTTEAKNKHVEVIKKLVENGVR